MWGKVYNSSLQILKEVHNFERLLVSILGNFHGFFQFQHVLTPSSHHTWKFIILQIHITTKLLRFLGFFCCYLPKFIFSKFPWLSRYFPFSFFKFLLVIKLQLSAFSPHPSTPPQLNPPLSPASCLPLDFVHVSFIVLPVIPSPYCPLPTPL